MIFCDDCRLAKGLPRHPGWPYLGYVYDDKCEICYKRGFVHDVPQNMLKKPEDRNRNEIVVDTVQQEVYRLKCDDVQIFFVRGPQTGRLNEAATKDLQQLFLHRNGDIDWVSTYELRIKARDGYNQSEGKIKSIGG